MGHILSTAYPLILIDIPSSQVLLPIYLIPRVDHPHRKKSITVDTANPTVASKPKEEHISWSAVQHFIESTFLYVFTVLSLIVVFGNPDPIPISVNIRNSFIDLVTAAACSTTDCEGPSRLMSAIFDLVVFSIVEWGWIRKHKN